MRFYSPLPFYGGKQELAKTILPLLPSHKGYVEPFFGSGALYWSKGKKPVEVIGDRDGLVINFWRQFEDNYENLSRKVELTLCEEGTHRIAKEMLKNPRRYSNLELAWALWTASVLGFSNSTESGFAFQEKGSTAKAFHSRKIYFQQQLSKRFSNTTIFNRDFQQLPECYMKEGFLWFLDPPYLHTDNQRYEGWTKKDEVRLLEFCEELHRLGAMFFLCGFDNSIRKSYRKKHPETWYFEQHKTAKKVHAKTKAKSKIETFTANFKFNRQLHLL